MDRIRLALAFVRAYLARTPGWLDTRTGRLLPAIAGGAPDGDGGGDGTGDEAGDGDGDEAGDGDGDEAGDGDAIKPDDDWKAKSRKNERAAKRERAAREKLQRELDGLKSAGKSEQEQAIEKARQEARDEALREAEQERRSDRLEVAVTRAAARGVKVGSDEDAKPVKFADPDDALLRVERALRRGDVEGDDLFDDQGQVNTDALNDALVEIARNNPHLVGEAKAPPTGDPDTGKGGPAKNDLESMTPDDHARRKYGKK